MRPTDNTPEAIAYTDRALGRKSNGTKVGRRLHMRADMPEMIERVARALCTDGYPQDAWDKSDDAIRDNWRWVARVAIAAMRDPTEAMLADAATAEDIWCDDPGKDPVALWIWRAMIDAALAQEEKP